MVDDLTEYEWDETEVRFWGGPLDGLVIEPLHQQLPDRDHNLFRHQYGVVHDPDGPSKTIYAFCPVHYRMEAVPLAAEAKAAPLEPEE